MAAAAAIPAATGAATRQQNNTLPFVRPGSAGPLVLDNQDTVFVAPPATGLPTAPLFVPAAPVAYGACTGDAWRAAATYVDVNAGVSDCFSGLETSEWQQVGGVGAGRGG